MARPVGSRNVGYFFRQGRGWYTQIAEPARDDNGNLKLNAKGNPIVKRRFQALTDDNGKPLRSKATPRAEVKAAYQRAMGAPVVPVDGVTVQEVCDAYLDNISDSGTTYEMRRDILYDFCTGYAPGHRTSGAGERIHAGYADRAVASLRPLDVDRWIQAHKGWKGSKRTKIQAIQRALNYGVESALIQASPLKGYRVPKNTARVTYITPEQEAALIAEAKPAMALAIKVLIRTGARPGIEFAALTAKHVRDEGDRMAWVFPPRKTKKREEMRILRITDKDVIAAVRERMGNKGPIFRSSRGTAWTVRNLSHRFRVLRNKVAKTIEFDEECVLYSCRHTYAKRTLQGYWSGKPTNIETLARLMDNTPQVCQAHYLQWDKSYEQPLWDNA